MHVASRTGRPEGVTLYGHRIRERRRALGLTQSALADLARLSVRTVRTAEQGDPVSTDTARCLGNTLRLAFVEIVRPASDVVRRQLEARGLAPVRLREPFRPVPALQALEAALSESVGGVIVVEGPRGVGKATVVRRLAALHEDTFRDGVIWVAASRIVDRAMLERLMLSIAECLGFAPRLPDPALVEPAAFDVAFCRHLWVDERLLVLADLEDPALLQPFTAEGTARVVVTTSRRWVAESVGDQRIEVAPWNDAAILDTLRERLGPERLADDPTDLLELIGGLPLYAQLAASGLQSSRYRTLGDFVARVRRAHDDERALRDPVVRSLVTTIHEDLDPELQPMLAELALAGTAPFTLPFAADALGRSPTATRRVLDELADAYLVLPVGSDDEELHRLADWAAGARPSLAAIERVLQGTSARLTQLRRERGPQGTFRWLRRHEALIRCAMENVLDVFPDPVVPARKPDDLPQTPSERSLAALPSLLLALDALFRYAPPSDGGRWLTAGLAVATTEPARAALGWMLGWWWMREGHEDALAHRWVQWAVARAEDPDQRASLALHGCILARRAHAMRDPGPWIDAEALTVSLEAEPALQACAALHGAVARSLTGGALEGPIERCGQALALARSVEDTRATLLAGAAAVNGTCLRVLNGIEATPVAPAIDALVATLRPEPTLLAGIGELGRLAGLTLTLPTLDVQAHYLGLEPADAEAALAHLGAVLGQLGCPGTGVTRDALEHDGITLASFDVSGWPLSEPPGIAFPLVLPLGDVGALVRAHRPVFEELIRAHREPGHPLLEALAAL